MPARWLYVASAALIAMGTLAGCSTATQADPLSDIAVAATPSPSPTEQPLPELPGGGRTVFPKYRLVGFSGIKGDPQESLGRLTGDLDQRCTQIKKIGKAYDGDGRTIMPVFEMITVVVQGSPGADGKYRVARPASEVRQYLDAARRCGALLLLNIQPGRSEFLPEMKRFERFLREPDVGVALDPEWAMDPGEVPGVDLGNTSGKELDQAAAYLATIVRENDLPEKVMVFHQFNLAAVTGFARLRPHEGVALIRSSDGLGSPQIKLDEYEVFTRNLPPYIHPGFKLFYQEDVNPPWGSRLMTPQEVMALRPRPEYVLYE